MVPRSIFQCQDTEAQSTVLSSNNTYTAYVEELNARDSKEK
jgi:hypothetical protein